MGETPGVESLYAAARNGNRRALGKLLSAIERGGTESEAINDLAFPDAGAAAIIGITGAPGAGKSTLTGALVAHLLELGKRPAVLAVDPSSPLSGGAILGDRIRMDDRAQNAIHLTPGDAAKTQPFIRSMATRGHTGGLALAVPAAVRLFDIGGYDPVIIETVGIGQVEVDVASATDTTVVVVTPGWGDSVQANKSGLLEVADIFVVNKADRPNADQAKRDLELMLDLSHVTGSEDPSGYRPPIIMTTATATDSGIDAVWESVKVHRQHLVTMGQLATRRTARANAEVRSWLEQMLLADAAELVAANDLSEPLNGTSPGRVAKQLYRSLWNR